MSKPNFITNNLHLLLLAISVAIVTAILFFIANFPAHKNVTLDKVDEVFLNDEDFLNKKLSDLTIEQKKGMLFMVAIPDKVLSEATTTFLKTNHIGGVIIMGSNIESEDQLKQLTSDLRSKVDEDILIAIDQEGGTVVRIKWDEFASVSARSLGQSGDLERAYNIAKYRAELLKGLGIDITFGPVADIGYTQSDFIFDRSFSSSPISVSNFVEATVKGYKDGGIISALKHFPGHGRTSVDSHTSLPTISLSRQVLENEEWVPFKGGIESGADMIMLAHIINPNISDKPASIDEAYLNIVNELGFKGILITDDLAMAGGIDGEIDYGINLTLESQEKVLERIKNIKPRDEYVKRVLELRMR